MTRFGCETLSQLQDRVLHEPAMFPALLRLPHRAGQRDVPRSRPTSARCARQVVPLLRTYPSLKVWVAGCSTGEEVYSLAILLREEGLLERTLIYATDINPQALQKAEAGVYDVDRIARLHREPSHARARTTSLSDYYTAAYGRAVFDKSLRSTSSSPTTAWRPTASSPRCSSSPAATCSSTSTASCRTARSGCSATRCAASGFLGHRREGVAALLGARRRVRRAGRARTASTRRGTAA